jgi:hypothetical protein
MPRAMDSAAMIFPRPSWIGGLLLLAIIETGCARLQSYRRPAETPPAGGVARADRDRPSSILASRPRLFGKSLLARHSRPSATTGPQSPSTPANDRTVVRSTAPPPGAVFPRQAAPNPPVSIALQPPSAPASETRGPSAVAADERPEAEDQSEAGSIVSAPTTSAPEEEAPDPPPDPAKAEIASLVASARKRLDGLANYRVRMIRQERVGEALQPKEEVLLSVRREPKAIRLEWPEGPHKGREVLYSATETRGMMQVKMAESLVPVPPLTLAPDSPLALRNSRHPITEAGFETILANMEMPLERSRKGDPSAGTLSDGGSVTPPELGRACRTIVRVTPEGETWTVGIDPETGLPAMVQATAANGDLLERYVFRDLRTELPDLATASAFDPSSRWGTSAAGGFLNRLARAAAADPKGDSAPPPR